MTPRFRMIAGPNGSGKTTLHHLLRDVYAVNFYTFLNADDMLAEARANGVLRMPLPVEESALKAKLDENSFPDDALAPFYDGRITLGDGFFRFGDRSAITSYTISANGWWPQGKVVPRKQYSLTPERLKRFVRRGSGASAHTSTSSPRTTRPSTSSA